MRLAMICATIFLVSVSGKGGGSRGGGGGSRGFSGSRSSSSSFRSSSGSSGSKSYSRSTYTTQMRSTVFRSGVSSNHLTYMPSSHVYVISSPSYPMMYGGYHYYWGGHYVSDPSRPTICEYEITDEDDEFRNVTFTNGTHPKTITFGCPQKKECCGMECCNKDSTNFCIIIGFVVMALVVACCFGTCKYGCNCNDTETVTVVTTTTTSSQPPVYTPQFVPPPLPPYPGETVLPFSVPISVQEVKTKII
ncbi:unnamed protein product [Caenorhabditis bovis]|uniref:CX domain-containing protein n=1 Tax=Caenorhabditis bovis TaxID=2654633 RepID=A0A8S1E5P8_9PELO|nr:unnamed protein product [Caenorhabditis bovis]